ncbi:MAG: sterol desaturase family protein, partial [Gammaproteobacteria bacterium]|nr:sterol desaturase family protein [Gammaproteobacteria bacterium]
LRQFDLGFAVNLLLAVLVFEFINYWFHRALHAYPWLWRIHAVHHSDTELDFTTTYRNHPLELFVVAPFTIPAVLLLGFPVAVVVSYQLMRMAISITAHSNIRLPKKVDYWLRWIVITPDYHRVHHSSDPQFTDSNFAGAFPLWDYVFGTAKAIQWEKHPSMEIGLEYFREPVDSRLDRLVLMPFVRWPRRASIPALQAGQNLPSSAS